MTSDEVRAAKHRAAKAGGRYYRLQVWLVLLPVVAFVAVLLLIVGWIVLT